MLFHVHNTRARKWDLISQRVDGWCRALLCTGTRSLVERPNPGMVSQALPVMVEEHIDHIFEEVRLRRGEEAALDLVNGLLQLGEPVVVLLCVVPGREGLI